MEDNYMAATLNAQQQLAVDLNNDKILCLAGAGTGKTFSMISRISRLVDDDGVDPAAILVLTFTHAAAFEMKERYQRSHLQENCPEFRTFHSFCYYLISSDIQVRKKLGYFNVPVIADVNAQKRIQTQVRMQCGIKLSDKKLTGKYPMSSEESYQYRLFNKAVQRKLRSENLITFDILCYEVCKLFVDDDSIIQKYKHQYQYIFVDEFQDTDVRQYDFVSSFTHSKLFVVGDALQAIYAFRGADSSIIKNISMDNKWTTVKLYHNYRSTKPICDYANQHSTYAAESYRIVMDTDRPGEAVSIQYIDGCECNTCDVDESTMPQIETLLSKSTGSSAILCRTNREVEYVTKYLSANNHTYSTSRKNDDVVHILRSIADNEYMIDWLSTYLNNDDYANYIRLLTIQREESADEVDNVKLFIDKFSQIPRIHTRIRSINQIRNTLCSDIPRTQKIEDIIDILNLQDIVIDTNKLSTISEFIACLIDAVNSLNDTDLYVGTIHSSKGLEYDNVFLIGVNDKSFRLTTEENKNLYYVGITRAKSHLTIFYCGIDDTYNRNT